MLNVSITINGDISPSNLAVLASLFGAQGAEVVAVDPKPKAATKTKVGTTAAETADEPKGGTVEASPAADEAPAAPTLADLQAAAPAYIKANTREAFAEKLAAVGAPNLSGVPEDKRAEFLASIKV